MSEAAQLIKLQLKTQQKQTEALVAADVDLHAVEQEIQRIRKSLSKYPLDNIFNMDKAVLIFRAIPNQSYLMPDEGDPWL